MNTSELDFNLLTTTKNSLEDFQREILAGPRRSYTFQLKIYDIFLPAVAGTIIILNLCVVFSSGLILHKRQQPRSTYIFLGNVALADMLTGIATLLGQYYPNENRTEIVCCLQIGLIVAPTLASIYSIALIAIDRYFYILHGLKYQQYLSSRRARVMVLITWIIGGILGFLPAMGIRNSTNGGKLCWFVILEPTGLLLATSFIGVLPLILIFILYFIILRLALGKIQEQQVSTLSARTETGLRYFRGDPKKRELSNVKSYRSSDVSSIVDTMNAEIKTQRSFFRCCRRTNTIKISSVYNPSRWKAIKIVALTTGCFFITWGPYFVASALYATCDNTDDMPDYCNNLRLAIASPLAILGLANSLINPFIYAWWHNGFRTMAKKLCGDLWQRSIKPFFNCCQCCCGDGSKNQSNIASAKKCDDESNTDSSKISKTASISELNLHVTESYGNINMASSNV